MGSEAESLEAFLGGAPVGAPPPEQRWPTKPPGQAIGKIRYTHDAMIDLIIAQPAISQNQLAAHFGYTASWVSQIIASDAFQARLAERRDEIVDPAIRASVEEQFKGLVLRSLDILREKLANPATAISDNLALRALELSSRALGYGARDNNPVIQKQEMHVHLDDLGGRLTALLHAKRNEPPIDGELVNEST